MSQTAAQGRDQLPGDTPNTMISIPGRNRTRQSRQKSSLGDGGTCAGEHGSGFAPAGSAQRHGDQIDVTSVSDVRGDAASLPGRTDEVSNKEGTQHGGRVILNIDGPSDNVDTPEGTRVKCFENVTCKELPKKTIELEDIKPSLVKDEFDNTPVIDTQSLDTFLSTFVKKAGKCDNDLKQLSSPSLSSSVLSEDVDQIKDDPIKDEDEEDTPSKGNSTRHHRQARLGMFPSTNWKRIRNTLKVASEMQGIKKQKHALAREDSFLKKFSTRNHQDIQSTPTSPSTEYHSADYETNKYESRFVIQHDGTFMFYWLGLMTLAVLYNIWTCIARQAFKEIQQGCTVCWYSFDALFDFLYICDILIQFRTGYLDQGLMVYDSRKLCLKYAHSKDIYVDFICLLPLDFIQFAIGTHPMIRFPRFLKVYRTFRFLYMLESRTAYPNLFRVANLTHLVLLGSHWFAAFYYMISEAEGFTGSWSYPLPVGDYADLSTKYLQSLYWATLTLTTIGDLPKPTNPNQYVFVIGSYLIGVFVFATIVGQVGNVINNRNASRIEFERLLDGAKVYMQTHNVPHNLQKRVQRWYDYVWSRGRLNGCDINSLGLLPDKLKTELAIHVNLETLKKVTIFHECQPEFLHDLVLKMKAYIFTPGDLICRRGEVAREMFIIADGVVEIISETGVMIMRMGAGDFFGEIGILNLDGGINRRSADVRSVGYLELFVLSREDVLEALKDHPEAESVIRDYGQRRLRGLEAHRQKVKPFKIEESPEESENHTDTPLVAQNRFLQTLKSWNSAVRKQSAQVTTNHMSPPAAKSADTQRFVPQRGPPSNKVGFRSIRSNNSSTTSGLAIVSIDKPDFSTGFLTNRFQGKSSEKRKRFGYLRLACAQLKNVFSRRKDKRWSMSVSDSPRRKFTEQRLLLKPADDQAVTLDLNDRSCTFKTGNHVTVNVEDYPGSTRIINRIDNSRDDGRSSNRSASNDGNISSCPVAESETVFLSTGFPERKDSACGQDGGRPIIRNISAAVSCVPVSTEDADEKLYSRGAEDLTDRAMGRQSQIILDVAKISGVWNGGGSEQRKSVSEAHVTYKEPSVCRTSPIRTSSSARGVVANSSCYIPNTGRHSVDVSADSCRSSPKHLIESGRFRSDLVNSTNDRAGSECINPPPERGNSASHPSSSFSAGSGISGHSQDYSLAASPKKSFGPSPRHHSARSAFSSSIPLTNHSNSFEGSSGSESPTLMNMSARSSFDHPSSTSSVSQGNPSPPCYEDTPAHSLSIPNYQQLNAPQYSLHRKSLVADTPMPNASKNSAQSEVISSSQAEAPKEDNKSPDYKTGQNGPKFSAQEFESCNEKVGQMLSRSPPYVQDGQFVLDELSGNISPLSRLNQDASPTTKRQENSHSGRSQPMSIIQQLTTDRSYQQLASEISVLHGLIDKRLTVLEEAFMSTTAQLDRLAASQDVLVQLLLQQMDGRPPEHTSLESQDDPDVVYRL